MGGPDNFFTPRNTAFSKDPPMTSNLDLAALKKVAKAATPGEWRVFHDKEEGYGGGVVASADGERTVAWHEDCPLYTRPSGDGYRNIVGDSDLGAGCGDDQTARNFDHIATFDPPTVLALIELASRAPGLHPDPVLLDDLVEVLRPFALYAEIIKHMGGNYPKSGTLISAETKQTGYREVLVEDFQRCAALLARIDTGAR